MPNPESTRRRKNWQREEAARDARFLDIINQKRLAQGLKPVASVDEACGVRVIDSPRQMAGVAREIEQEAQAKATAIEAAKNVALPAKNRPLKRKSRYGEHELAPEGWMTAGALGTLFNVGPRKVVELLSALHTVDYPAGGRSRLRAHYPPLAVDIVRRYAESRKTASDDSMSERALAEVMGINYERIARYAKEVRRERPDINMGEITVSEDQPKPVFRYSSAAIAEIKRKAAEEELPPGHIFIDSLLDRVQVEKGKRPGSRMLDMAVAKVAANLGVPEDEVVQRRYSGMANGRACSEEIAGKIYAEMTKYEYMPDDWIKENDYKDKYGPARYSYLLSAIRARLGDGFINERRKEMRELEGGHITWCIANDLQQEIDSIAVPGETDRLDPSTWLSIRKIYFTLREEGYSGDYSKIPGLIKVMAETDPSLKRPGHGPGGASAEPLFFYHVDILNALRKKFGLISS